MNHLHEERLQSEDMTYGQILSKNGSATPGVGKSLSENQRWV